MRITCAYYRNKIDGTLWAIRTLGVVIVEAVGPVSQAELNTPPMARRAAIRTNVTGWDLRAFVQVSEEYEMVRKTPIPAGLRIPSRRAELLQTDNGFCSRLTHV